MPAAKLRPYAAPATVILLGTLAFAVAALIATSGAEAAAAGGVGLKRTFAASDLG
jgi:hypothetical protein